MIFMKKLEKEDALICKENLIDELIGYDVKFRTWNVDVEWNYEGIGRVTSASIKNKDKLYIQFSFCSPKDRYNKHYGQWLATVRLFSHKRTLMMDAVPGVRKADEIKKLIIMEGKRKNILWMKDVTEEQIH